MGGGYVHAEARELGQRFCREYSFTKYEIDEVNTMVPSILTTYDSGVGAGGRPFEIP